MRAPLLPIAILATLSLPASAAAAAPCDSSRVDKAAGVARTLSDCGRVDLARGAEGAARQALGRVSGALGVRRDTRDLGVMRRRSTAGGPRVRFQQFVGGVPVRNGQVAVALDKRGNVLNVASGAVRDTTLDTSPRVSRTAALLTARRRVPGGFDTVVAPTTTLVAEPSARGTLRLAWQVTVPAREPRGDWTVIVSATTGEVLEANDTLTRDTGTALTYAPNPVQMTGSTGLRDGGNNNQPALNTARATFVLNDLNSGTGKLTGTHADVANPTADDDCSLPYTPGLADDPTPPRTYNFTRDQPAFEEAQAYLAVTEVQRTYAALGFPGIVPGPVRINVHCIGADNSFFSTADDALHMGDGGVDDAEDSDVTVHEFGHATQAAQVPGFGPVGDTEQRAMGEGFGDFLATFFYLEDGNATYQSTRRYCVMEWDATSYNPVDPGNPGSGCLRWVDGTDESTGQDIGTYPGTPEEEHSDGRYWSAWLTCVFEGIEPTLGTTAARNRMLELVLAHHEDLVPSDGAAFNDSLAALRAEDQARFGGADVALINRCGEQRLGIGTPPVVTGALAPAQPDGANGWYRSAPTPTWSTTDPETATRRTAGCLENPQTDDTPGRTLSCTATSAGGTTTGSVTYKKDGTPPALAPKLSASPTVGRAVVATPGAGDATSGVAAQFCGAVDTSTTGAKTVACTATDNAGNTAARTLSYTVGVAPVRLRVSKVKVSRTGTITFRLRVDRSVRFRITAKSGKVKFRSQSKRFTKDRNIKVTLKLSAKQRRAFLKKLRTGKRQKVVVTLKPTGAKAQKLTLRVRRR